MLIGWRLVWLVAGGACLLAGARAPAKEPGEQDQGDCRQEDGDCREPEAAGEVVITAARLPARSLPFSVEVLDAGEIGARHANTLAEAASGLAGISFESDGPVNARIGIRGLIRERISLLLDGNRQFIVRNAGTDIPVDPWDVARVEIIRGGSGLAYANDAVGGLINVILERPPPTGSGWRTGYALGHGYASASSELHTGLRAWASGEGGSYAQVSATHREALDDVRTPRHRVPNTRYRNFTSSLVAGHRLGPGLLELTYHGKYGSSIGTYSSRIVQDPDLRHLVAARYRFDPPGPLGTTELRASFMRFDVDFRFLGEPPASQTTKWFIGEWNNLALQADTRLRLFEGNTLFAGTHLLWGPTRRWQESPGGDLMGDVFPRAARLGAGAVLQDLWAVSERVALSAVARLDYDRLSHGERRCVADAFQQAVRMDRAAARARDYLSLSGQLGLNLVLETNATLRASLAAVSRPPVPGKFSLFVPAAPGKPGRAGNPALELERSFQAELGFRHERAGTVFDLSAFAARIEGYMTEYLSAGLADPADPELRYRTFTNQDAFLYGVEAGVRQTILPGRIILHAALGFVQGRFDRAIPDAASSDRDLPFLPPLRGFVELELVPLRDLTLRLRLRYAGDQDHNSDLAGESPTPGYLLVDASADYRIEHLWWFDELRLYLAAANLTDAAYREHTVQYKGVAVGFEQSYLQPGIDIRAGATLFF